MNNPVASTVSNEELQLVSQTVSSNLRRTRLSVPDMRCGTCMNKIEKALGTLDGVEEVRVNLTNKSLSVTWSNAIEPSMIIQKLLTLGYHPVLPTEQVQQSDSQLSAYLRAIAVSGFAAGNVMLLSVSVWAGADQSTQVLFHWLSALITIPAIVYSGRFFFQSAWHALRSGTSNMDVPISVGIFLASMMSVYDTVTHAERVYFEAAMMLVFFLLIGRTIDHLVRNKANSAIDGLNALEPAGAKRLMANGRYEFVSTSALDPGDHIIVEPGDRVPVDGTVTSGTSDINSEIVDGESLPRAVQPNQPVFSGTLNLASALEIKVTASAANSFLASVQQLVQFGEGQKGPYRLLADKVSDWYTPFVHCAALIAFFWWFWSTGNMHQSISVAITVLIITCPCALALAVPMVQAIAAQRLFASGIIMKNAAALEKIKQVDFVVVDKTGTLTDTMQVVSSASNYTNYTLTLAQLLATVSEHPYATAITCLPHTSQSLTMSITDAKVENIKDVPGFGVEANMGNQTVRLGKRCWASATVNNENQIDQSRSESVLSVNGTVVADFQFEQQLRADAKPAVALLKDRAAHIIIVSGDSPEPVKSIASQLAITSSFATCLPADKLDKILKYKEQGHEVLMVGDGLNDAGAMAAATVSIAPANAASVSRTVADFVFLRKSLLAVPEVFTVADQAHKLVRQNFAIALIYNMIALPLAFSGLVTPLLAAIFMSTSSILVVANATRIRQRTTQTKSEGRLQTMSMAT